MDLDPRPRPGDVDALPGAVLLADPEDTTAVEAGLDWHEVVLRAFGK
jgi:hypothetical protein